MFNPYENIKKITLDNGIDIYVCYWPVNFTHIIAGIHAGHCENPIGKEGVAHLAEHVAAAVSQLKTKSDLANLLGANYSLGSTDPASTYITTTIPNQTLRGVKTTNYLSRALNYVDDYFFNIQQKNVEEIFQQEKTAVINECFHRDKSPDLAKRFKKIYHEPWGELNYMRREYPETIQLINQADVMKFIEEHYTTKNMSIAIIGGIDFETVVNIVLASTLNVRHQTGSKKKIFSKEKIKLGRPAVFQSRINAIDFGSIDFGQAQISMQILTTQHSSAVVKIARSVLYKHLMKELREKRHMTYGITMNVECSQNIVDFNLSTRLPKEHLDNIESLIEEQILECAKSMNEIVKTKKLILAEWRIHDHSFFNFAKNLGKEISRHGKPIPSEKTYNSFKFADPEKVAQFLNFFAEKQNRFTVFVHP